MYSYLYMYLSLSLSLYLYIHIYVLIIINIVIVSSILCLATATAKTATPHPTGLQTGSGRLKSIFIKLHKPDNVTYKQVNDVYHPCTINGQLNIANEHLFVLQESHKYDTVCEIFEDVMTWRSCLSDQ